jgi:hypothetical protein
VLTIIVLYFCCAINLLLLLFKAIYYIGEGSGGCGSWYWATYSHAKEFWFNSSYFHLPNLSKATSKKLFSISANTLNSVTFQQQPDFCEDWFSVSLKSFIYISYFLYYYLLFCHARECHAFPMLSSTICCNYL